MNRLRLIFVALSAMLLVFVLNAGPVFGLTLNTPVTNITLDTNLGVVGEPLTLDATVFPQPPANGNNGSFFNAGDIVWSLAFFPPFPAAAGATVTEGGTVSVTSEGNVRVMARIPGGGAGGADFTQTFVISFSSREQTITANVQGLNDLHVGVEVRGRILFTLSNGEFTPEIVPSDFVVFGLPTGLRAEPAVRISATEVSVPIVGTPIHFTSPDWVFNLTVPSFINQRNVRGTNMPVSVTVGDLNVGAIGDSAGLFWHVVYFDLNPQGDSHRDHPVVLDLRGTELRRIMFGNVELVAYEDYSMFFAPNVLLHRSFLSRVTAGEWELTFDMRAGANPVVMLRVYDSRVRPPFVHPYFPTVPGPQPAPPLAPPHPDGSFVFMSGGRAVNLFELPWERGVPRINPLLVGNTATATLGVELLNYWNQQMPGSHFEIVTPMARVGIPSDIMSRLFGRWTSADASRTPASEASLRISLTDRTDNDGITNAFHGIYPYGQIMGDLVDLQMDFVTSDGEVIFTTAEFSSPLEISFPALTGNTAHMRPAGMRISGADVEFVPHHVSTGHVVTVSTIIPGVFGVMHNGSHFNDVPHEHWAFEQAHIAAYTGLVVANGSLGPYHIMSKGEFVDMVAFAMHLPRAEVRSPILNIAEGESNLFGESINRAYTAGLLGIWQGQVIDPNSAITRQEMAAIAGSALLRGDPVRESTPRALSAAFSDADEFEAAHALLAQEAVNYRVIVGYPDSTYRPTRFGSRIEAVGIAINLAWALGVLSE